MIVYWCSLLGEVGITGDGGGNDGDPVNTSNTCLFTCNQQLTPYCTDHHGAPVS